MKGWHSHTVCCAEHWVLLVKAPITGIYFLPREPFVFLCYEQQQQDLGLGSCLSRFSARFVPEHTCSVSLHSFKSRQLDVFSLSPFFPLVLAPMSQWLSVLPVHFKYLVLFKDTIWAGRDGLFLQPPILSVVLLSDVSVISWSTLV